MIPKSSIIGFKRASTPIKDLITKFGGKPNWVADPQWPLSKGWDNRPMMFLAQIKLEPKLFNNKEEKMAYIFISHQKTVEDDFFDPDIIYPDAGENAIIIQPGGEYNFDTINLEDGPTLFDEDNCTYEGYADLLYNNDPEFINKKKYKELNEKEKNVYLDEIDEDKIGGVPNFFQADEWPDNNKWYLLLQLNTNFLPFYLNVGASPTIFAFISENHKQGKLLIQDF